MSERRIAAGLVVGSLLFSGVVVYVTPWLIIDQVVAAFAVGVVILAARALGEAIGRRLFR